MEGQSLTDDKTKAKREAFLRIERLRKKRTVKEAVSDYDAELASHRESKYGDFR